jgi:ring-1,2-phenylacetyl-CoA epoxidase subunit PaaD
MAVLTRNTIWQLLEEVKDPEIPVVSIVEMGMVRDILQDGGKTIILLAPTFAGCPALQVMQEEIRSRLEAAGLSQVEVKLVLSPPWSSDDITPQARQKLSDFGLAPPARHQGLIELAWLQPVLCPYCSSSETILKNGFGSTLCRAIYFCNHCNQPFEQFKPL